MPAKPVYPYVRCAKPGHADEPGFAVCKHIIQGAVVAHCAHPTPERLGELLCAACKATKPPLSIMRLCCAECARNQSWVNLIGAPCQ